MTPRHYRIAAALLWLAAMAVFAQTFAGCATFKKVTQTSFAGLQQGYIEIEGIIVATNKTEQEKFRERSRTTATPSEQLMLEAEQVAYEKALATVTSVVDKIRAAIKGAEILMPLLDLVMTPEQRTQLTQWITKGMVALLEAKNLLPSLGVKLPGGL